MIEFVWDEHRAGTATTPSGRWLCAGEEAEFSPDDLLATAAAACLMRTCASLAAEGGVDFLSFAATAQLAEDAPPSAARVCVRVQMVISEEVPEARMLALWSDALQESPVANVIGDRLDAQIEVTRLLTAPLRSE